MARKTAPANAPIPAASRSVVPIPSTIARVPGYPDKLVIFKVPASPYWWMRTHEGKPIKRSTRTTDKRQAIEKAKAFFEQLLLDRRLGVGSTATNPSSFMHCAEQVIADDAAQASRDQLSDTYVASQRGIIRNHIQKFFRQIDVRDVDYMMLDNFKNKLFAVGLIPSSVKLHFVAVKKVLDYAQRANIIKTSPLLPRVKNEDNPRGYFNLKEYHLLRTTTLRMIGTVSKVKQVKTVDDEKVEKNLRNIIISRELLYLIPFMIYTFIRPGDLKAMKHKHIEIRKGADGDYLWMTIPPSKKHDKPIASMPRAAIFYRKLLELRRSAQGTNAATKADDYVFMPQHQNRKYAYRQLARQFDVVLKAADLKEGSMGEPRTLYSLRHTSLMYRTRYGGEINPVKFARNARTSVEMLERFYLSKLENSHFTAELHAKKTKKRKRKETSIITDTAKPLDLAAMMKQAQDAIPEGVRKKKLVARQGKLSIEED
jgi:integrase